MAPSRTNSSTTRSVIVSPFSTAQKDSFPPPRLMKLAASESADAPVSSSCAGVARRTSICEDTKSRTSQGQEEKRSSNVRWLRTGCGDGQGSQAVRQSGSQVVRGSAAHRRIRSGCLEDDTRCNLPDNNTALCVYPG
jgi:hypothetical protein|eukprot:COSAG06_NODE_2008_length_7858_cov_3.404176_6_plen_137_part_00